jgi:hypothetical protein
LQLTNLSISTSYILVFPVHFTVQLGYTMSTLNYVILLSLRLMLQLPNHLLVLVILLLCRPQLVLVRLYLLRCGLYLLHCSVDLVIQTLILRL